MTKLCVLMTATPMPGHVSPLVGAARGLVQRGHEVVFHTGSVFKHSVEQAGARFVPLHREIDYDYRHIDERFPERAQLPPGPAQMLWGVKHLFADSIALQYDGLCRVLAEQQAHGRPVDVVVMDTMFYGALPLLLKTPVPRKRRLPVVCLGVSVLAQASVDTAFFGQALPPSSTQRARVRNGAINRYMQSQVFGPLQEYVNEALRKMDCPALPHFIVDASSLLPDRYLQLTTERFDYPHSDLPTNFRYAGPLIPPPAEFVEPSWWSELDGPRPVIVVTQGTLANADPRQLIVPTLQALAHEDVLVVAGTGGPPIDVIPGPIPANARLGTFLPFHQLLPKADVLVTNGGLGGVTHALSLGVPLVVAGDSEEKPEIGARIAWNGCGLNLATGQPEPELLRNAVNEILSNLAYRAEASVMQDDFARYDAVGAIEQALREVCMAEEKIDAPA